MIIVFGRTAEIVEKLKKEIENILKEVQQFKEGRVKVEGVVIE